MSEQHDSTGKKIVIAVKAPSLAGQSHLIERCLRDITRFGEMQQTPSRESSFIDEIRKCGVTLREGGAEIVCEIPKLNIPSRLRDRAVQLGAIMSKIASSFARDDTELNDLLQRTSDLELRRLQIDQINIILDPLVELANALHAEDTPDCEKAKKIIIKWCGRVLDGSKHALAAVPAKKTGIAEDLYLTGLLFLDGDGVKQDHTEAANKFRAAANLGHAKAQKNLGYLYENGYGVPQNHVEAVRWYQRAAEQGLAGAQNDLGVCYETGQGVQRNYPEAVKWYSKAAALGQVLAQLNLGNCHRLGKGIPQNHAKAAEWLRKAAEQGNVDAQALLGIYYSIGQGVPQDLHEAAKWYQKAAEQGDANSQYYLGGCFEFGNGVPMDIVRSAKWYLKAAEQGTAGAQFAIGSCYHSGQGVPEDHAESIKWWRKAAEQGHAEARKRADADKVPRIVDRLNQ